MAFKGNKKSNEEKMKEIEDLTNGMTEQIESYFVSEKAMREHLSFMSNFHNYSIRNMTLIDKQFQGAQAVGSFNFWKIKGVSVQKGEKGIKILVPTPVQYFKQNGKEVQVQYATQQEKEMIAKKEIQTSKKLFFKIGNVFEYTQTNARELNMSVSQIFDIYHKDGVLENNIEMLAALHKVADKLSFKILDQPPYEIGTAKGVAFPNEKMIALNPRNTEFENVTTLIHELAHAKMHTPERRKELSTNEREFQAEMVSYVVANKYGIDTEDFTLSYLAGWTKNTDLKDKEQLLNEVRSTSSEFIDEIDAHFEFVKEKELEKENPKDYYTELLTIQEKNGLSTSTVELGNQKFIMSLKENNPEDYINYLSNKALYEHELIIEDSIEVKEPMMFVHGISTEFKSFGEVNNLDFDDYMQPQTEYTVVIPNEEKEMTVISGQFEKGSYVHPLHHLKKENIVDKDTYKSLESNYHNALIEVDDEYIKKVANRIRGQKDRGQLDLPFHSNEKLTKKPKKAKTQDFEMEK